MLGRRFFTPIRPIRPFHLCHIPLSSAPRSPLFLTRSMASAASKITSQNPKGGGNLKKKKAKAVPASAFPLELHLAPAFFDHLIKTFEKLKAEHDGFVKSQPRVHIVITMPDGSERKGKSWETSPMDVAKEVSKSLSERIVIAKVDGELWDLERPLEGPCKLELLDFELPEGKKVLWHSSAHVLGEAAERHYGCHLCLGPPTDEGFFYEMGIEDRAVTLAEYPSVEKVAESAIKEKQKFERLVVKKETLLEMFNYNKYKKHLIETKVPDGTSTTVHGCGPMIDLCNSSSYFLGDANNESLQRIYGISFPVKKQLTEYKAFLEEAAKRDHRRIGKDQELFSFNELSPGSCFFLPHGTRIYNTLTEFIRCGPFRLNPFTGISPNMFHSKLWQQSGHWQNYKDDMFGLKPMNCPSHCIIFGSRDRSYRELPIRMAEFGILHRNEASGALTGLTRVRRFAQDDTHVFCMPSQVAGEISALFDFMQHVYGTFRLDFQLELSTRPDNFLGDIKTWDHAGESLEKRYPGKWELSPGDGAFYGPKIDISIRDSLSRSFQCATIQLDFQLPNQFDLKYRGEDTQNPEVRPVMIHRAILGSLERFIAIITEHFAGKWPFWLSPRQVVIIPVGPAFKDYVVQVHDRLKSEGFFVDIDNGPDTLSKKIRNAEISQHNFILVVGEAEMTAQSVNVRNRDIGAGAKGRDEMMSLDDFVTKLHALKTSRSLENKL
ncbi:aa-TRNA-ligase-II domain-containing protein [Favolaschia claudopus]|uniref:Probable threonine--tRNA ligase, cytoplasmic n=1 Tax=Favolaschia claudopus TaxID=2862362 RepID=A0AAW0A2A0_9AGAR